jgi:uncharacterized protein (TIGR03083 family)
VTGTFDLIAAERRRTADFLDTLDEGQGATPSLCSRWTVREVAAHLVMPFRVSMPQLLLRMVRYGGNFDRLSEDFARRAGQEPLAALAAELRANAGHRFSPPTLGPEAPLTDVVVHTLDMRVPLGAGTGDIAPEALDTILTFLMTPKATRGFLPKGRTAGLSFRSTDTSWSGGDGAEVRGPAASLALALTGRQDGLDGLEGEGVPELARRLAAD